VHAVYLDAEGVLMGSKLIVKRLAVAVALVLAAAAVQLPACAESGYLAGQEVDFHTFLPGPPAVDSLWDRADQSLVESYQNVEVTRFQMADLDANDLYPRFAAAFGHPIDKQTTPALVTLLDRAIDDVDVTAAAAKDHFHRPRPFQRLQLQRVCDKSSAPKPEEHPTSGTSYPSGHSTHGWTVAMILARVAPDREDALIARAQEYEESRLVCGMHFPSDVEAGHEVAIAVVARLDGSKDFQADLNKARMEHTKH
jgi:acid phosphatase (class A)